MKLKDIIGIKEHNIISIVGAGGKTTLMYYIGKELKEDGKVLMSTTTKILPPKKEEADFFVIGKEEYINIKNQNDLGSYVYSYGKSKEGKLLGVREDEISLIKKDFKYMILESDGSKCKALKGWNDTEPVIYKETDITIGVLNIKVLEKKINDDLIHRLEEFKKLTEGIEEYKITNSHLIRIIFNEKGLFKNSKGKRILFINKVESPRDYELLKYLIEDIEEENKKSKLVDKIIYGSLKEENFNYVK
ncbi:selenium cofactor biosynthesis protein YqeC [Clostridium sp.]|uniref:selenium cofactor biosynthesis protein YqeC n=1 Tax=Clostridium sp. TaxID=1506 RepID=UPI002621CE98|nr:selenium cofactor biosynthesis protein YqeC [Clostridium sp.]